MNPTTPTGGSSPFRLPLRLVVGIAVRLLLSLAPIVFGVAWGIRETHTLTATDIAPAEGYRYTALVPPSAYEPLFHVEGDGLRHARRARTRFYEDGRRLGPPHRPHDYIRDDGLGQFSHWGTTLYFSASDNTDPRTNGRTYTIVAAATLPFEVVWIWGLCVLSSAVVAVWLPSSQSVAPRNARNVWKVIGATLLAALYLGVGRYSIGPSSDGYGRGGAALSALWAASLLTGAILAWRSGGVLAKHGPRVLKDARADWDELSARAGRPFARPGWRGWTWRAASLVVPFIVFAVLLRLSLPRQVLVLSYYFATPPALAAGVVLWCCHARRSWIGCIAGLTVTLALFALPLAALWQHVGIHGNAVGGLLPWSDASGYYYDARRLLDGHPLGWSARRPLFAGLLATLLASTGQNLQLSLAVLVGVNAVASFLLARELRISQGPAAAAIATIVLWLFYRIEGGCGTVLTENIGFAMGTVAFAVLWRGSREADARRFCMGLALLTVALMARAGAFFVLPALVLAGAWAIGGNRQWLRVGVGALAAVAVAAGLTLGVGRLLSDPAGGQTTFSNFSYSLYGLVVGGKGWGQVLSDHSAATEGAEIYSLAWQAFRARPMGLVEGSLRMWDAYFRPSASYHAFAFVHDGSYGRLVQIVCYCLSALGLGLSVLRYRHPSYALLLAATVGHVGSIPFVPPIDAGLRVYAATLPILAILISVGAAGVLEWSRCLVGGPRLPDGPAARVAAAACTSRSAEVFGAALVIVVFAGPLCVFYTSRPPIVENAPCPERTVPVHVRLSRGSFLRITGNVPDLDDTPSAVPEIRENGLRDAASQTELKNDVNRFAAGHTMANLYDLKTGRYVWLVAPSGLLSGSGGVVQVCGQDSPDSLSRRYGIFYADSVAGAGDAHQGRAR